MMSVLNRKVILYTVSALLLGTLFTIGLHGVRWAFYQGYIRFNYPSPAKYPVRGIDVSHHQGAIDWDRLDKKDIQFIFIKATEGGNFKDTLFQKNWRKAKQLNIPMSVYHFFTFCTAGKEQANHFIKSVPKEILSLPPAIDLEFTGNCKVGRRTQLVDEIAQYIAMVEQYYQQKVIIYTTPTFYQRYLMNKFLDNPIWIRDVYKLPTLPDNRTWTFWQYASKGRMEGIKGFVDLNVFYGTQQEFEHLLRQ